MAPSSLFLIVVVAVWFAPISSTVVSVEQADGSFSTGVGDTARSIFSLLSKSPGWTDETLTDDVAESRSYNTAYGASLTVNPGGVLSAPAEVLRLIEGFVELKGEVASRLHAVLADNWDLITGVYKVLMSKIATLHGFSLTGIRILRKIIEFAIACISQWQITIPSWGGSAGTEAVSYGAPSHPATDFGSGHYY